MNVKARLNRLEMDVTKREPLMLSKVDFTSNMTPEEILTILKHTVERMEAKGYDGDHVKPHSTMTDREFVNGAKGYIKELEKEISDAD
jgi:hypothetical protein